MTTPPPPRRPRTPPPTPDPPAEIDWATVGTRPTHTTDPEHDDRRPVVLGERTIGWVRRSAGCDSDICLTDPAGGPDPHTHWTWGITDGYTSPFAYTSAAAAIEALVSAVRRVTRIADSVVVGTGTPADPYVVLDPPTADTPTREQRIPRARRIARRAHRRRLHALRRDRLRAHRSASTARSFHARATLTALDADAKPTGDAVSIGVVRVDYVADGPHEPPPARRGHGRKRAARRRITAAARRARRRARRAHTDLDHVRTSWLSAPSTRHAMALWYQTQHPLAAPPSS